MSHTSVLKNYITAIPDAEHVATAERLVTAKAIAEFSHEKILTPVVSPHTNSGPTSWKLSLRSGYEYSFTAEILPLNHWLVDPASLQRHQNNSSDETALGLSCAQFIVDARGELNISTEMLGHYLTEVNATVTARAMCLHTESLSSADLVHASLQQRESALTLGHPCFVATNGRIGFSALDHQTYPPEASSTFAPLWVAMKASLAEFALDPAVIGRYDQLIPDSIVDAWQKLAATLGCPVEQYQLMPVHPWQWNNVIHAMFGPNIGRRELVLVGEDPDQHRAQQSIRTALSQDNPTRPYIKTSLSIRNMGFTRGMSPTYVRSAPAICSWVHDQLSADPYLTHSNFRVLREFASAGFIGDIYHSAVPGQPETKVLAALWRENPATFCAPGQSLCSMAALLHRDSRDVSMVSEMVKDSALNSTQWLESFLDVYAAPILHILVEHRMAFMPHGENIILTLENSVPVGANLKDVAEEVVVASPEAQVPPGAERILHALSDDDLSQCFHTDVVDGFLRHLSAIFAQDQLLDVDEFWSTVAMRLRHYESLNPEVKRLELFAPEVQLSCLNRLQLRNTQTMVDLSDPVDSLIYAGSIPNPLAILGPVT